ncbi:MAG: VWA domain-containing protein [Pyrinomonadaceae bacterium]|nr:VWA domain-containing protein [Pyrinomonadaceae bacterium]
MICRYTPSIARLFFSITILFGASIIASAQSGRVQATPTPTPEDDTVRIVTEEIKLNVLAFDEKGDFFRDVNERDLVISENNILHQPVSVRRLPANVLIIMDTGGELRAVKSLDQTRKVAKAVVDALRPGDAVAVMQYSDKAEIVTEWTSDKAQALAAIKRANFGRRSMFVDAIKLATDFMLRSGVDNKHIILITDGTDSMGRSSAKFDAFQRLMATDISVHVISYTSMEAADIEPRTKGISNTPPPKAMPDEIAATLPNGVKDKGVKIGPTISLDRTLIKKMKARQLELETSQEQLEKLAESTNGEYILPTSLEEMVEKAALVAKMVDASYVVTYMPKVSVVETRGIAERNIDVTSRRAGLIVVARRKLLFDTKNQPKSVSSKP